MSAEVGWMRRLADHYATLRSRYPSDLLVIVFDIDGTILDLRHTIRHVLLGYDRARGSSWFSGLGTDDVDVHENRVDDLLGRWPLPDNEREMVAAFYREHFWHPDAVLAAHQPYRGVMDVIRWFQLQPHTEVALNTGRPEHIRDETLASLNALGKEYRVEFSPALLLMNSGDWGEHVVDSKVAGIGFLQQAGYRVVAVVDNEPENLEAMTAADEDGEVLFLHAATIYESRRRHIPRSVTGDVYDITELVSEHHLPRHVQLVWDGLDEPAGLQRFTASGVRWGACDVRLDPLERLVVRRNSFEASPWSSNEPRTLDLLLRELNRTDRGVKLRLHAGGRMLGRLLSLVDDLRLAEGRLWFSADLAAIGELGFRQLAEAKPTAVISAPVDFVAPLVFGAPAEARELLDRFRSWGINRLSLSWTTPNVRDLLTHLEEWGHEVDLCGVTDLESFLQATLLLPRSVTADLAHPEWSYFGAQRSFEGTRPLELSRSA